MRRLFLSLRRIFWAGLLLWAGAECLELRLAAEGAAASKNWALQPLMMRELPALRSNLPPLSSTSVLAPLPENPIDRWIGAALDQHGLAPASEADRATLLRRVSFDLIGLPPTPEEVESFLQDRSPEAYGRVVNRLLDSPRYGERWARHWMDAVHFAETHGHDQDRIRTNAWPYRDYLIQSFNSDKPYARFVEEQVAGDVLFPEDPRATVGLGFLAAGPWDESSLRDIREDTLDRQIGRYLDRDDMLTTVMQTFTSTTVQCARCHDHKFDPIPQRDYYALQAVFAGVDRANRTYDADAKTTQRRKLCSGNLALSQREDRAFLLSESSQAIARAWEADRSKVAVEWVTLDPDSFVSSAGAHLTKQPDGSLLVSGTHGPTDTYTISAPAPEGRYTAIRLEALPDESLPHRGPGREANGNMHLSEVQVVLFENGATTGRVMRVVRARADFSQTDWTIEHAIDGNEKTAWGIYPNVGQSHMAVFEWAEPVEVKPGSRWTLLLKQLHGGHCIGRPRLSVTSSPVGVALAPIPTEIETIHRIPESQRTESDRVRLAAWIHRQHWAEELAKLPKPAYVYAAASQFEPDGGLKPAGGPREVHILRRGEITKPGELAHPGALTAILDARLEFRLEGAPEQEGNRRAALAHWLTSVHNPLTWRSIVNRVWHHHFGRGLAPTLNDFGKMGESPSHPELLDWLAIWFRDEAHGSLKALHRLLVTSRTYVQSTHASDMDKDPENRWFARMHRTRLDAEQLRDAMLQVAGDLDLRMGGPSDQQFELQPGIHVTPKVDYSKFRLDGPAGRRRSVYRFLFRTLPDPFMDALDCPAGDQLTPIRNASVTVQQALALWNNAFVALEAEHLAARLERERSDLKAQIEFAYALLLNRRPSSDESAEVTAYARQHGLANAARVLLNSNEFLFVN